ncbi:unnamed protein product [Brachionus calyciflorus]|uniref:G-protein coupled receptors family 1 profile domain-containing protein n=1 Tax=Brachionus calyciflorus TaxID=104777 RepID=A0A813TB59_9BILA|nr:unnamed protein product [Brachionus calyciflorus]
MSNQTSNTTLTDLSFFNWVGQFTADFLLIANLLMTPMGLVANTLSIFVFLGKRFESNFIRNYYITIAIYDNLTAIIAFIYLFPFGFRLDLQIMSVVSCRLIAYYIRIIPQMSAWVNVMLTIDMLSTVKRVKRNGLLQNTKTFIIAMILLLVLFHLVDAPNLWLRLENVESGNTTRVICTGDPFIVLFRDLISQVFRVYMPYITVFFLNLWLIKILTQSKRKVLNNTSRKDWSFAFSIMSMNVFYCINSAPLSVIIILTQINANDSYYRSYITIFSLFATYLNMFNHYFTIFINLKFNKIFRLEFKDLMRKWLRLKAKQRIRFAEDNSLSYSNSIKPFDQSIKL